MTDSERLAYGALTAMALCFGGTWVAGAVAVDHVPPFMVAMLRFAVATFLLFAWVRLGGRRLVQPRRDDLPLLIGLGLTAIAGYNWLFLTGLTLAPASDGAIIVPGLAPVFTALIAWPALSERLGGWGAVGLLVAAIGLVLVVGDPSRARRASPATPCSSPAPPAGACTRSWAGLAAAASTR